MITFMALAIGAVLIVEGLVYALAPQLLERVLEALRELSLQQRRLMGLLMLVLGTFLVVLAS